MRTALLLGLLGLLVLPGPVAAGDADIPQARAATGGGTIAEATLAGPADRTGHVVPGAPAEASRLVVRMHDGRVLDFSLPGGEMFEDLAPRIADLDGDGVADLAIPSFDRRRLRFLSFRGGVHEISSPPLPAAAVTDFGLFTMNGKPAVEVGLADGAHARLAP